MPRPRIVYAGTPEFAVAPLKALLERGFEVVAVYTQPDRPAGRGRKLTPSPVKTCATAADIPVEQPETLKIPEARARLRALAPDLMIVAAYGLLLPQAVLDIPRLGCVNIHGSILPRWRGAAPIQRALLAGDAVTGISIMAMEAGLDTGPVFATREIPITPDETGGSLHDRLAALGAQTLLDTLPGILDGSIRPTPQDDTLATYAHKLSKDESRLDWRRSAIELDRQVRAFDPWPVAECRLGEGKLRIWGALALEGGPAHAEPGRVLDAGKAGIDVATGAGTLRITELQAPGKRRLSAADFINAHPIAGALLE